MTVRQGELMLVISGFERMRQEGCWEFETTLSYMVNFLLAWASRCNTLSQNKSNSNKAGHGSADRIASLGYKIRPGLKGSKERECAFLRVCSNVLECPPKQWAFREILSLEEVSGKNHVLVGDEESYVKVLSWKSAGT